MIFAAISNQAKTKAVYSSIRNELDHAATTIFVDGYNSTMIVNVYFDANSEIVAENHTIHTN